MRFRRAVPVLACGAAALAAAAPAAIPSPARVQVTAREFTLTLSRTSIRRGPAVLELLNLGEDDHDLVIQRVGSTRPVGRIEPLHSRTVADRELNLRAGKYVLWCSIADHRQLGMQTRLTVVAPKKARHR